MFPKTINSYNKGMTRNSYYKRAILIQLYSAVLNVLGGSTTSSQSGLKGWLSDQVNTLTNEVQTITQLDREMRVQLDEMHKKAGNYENLQHPFHLVPQSPWPFVTSISVLTVTIGAVMYMHSYQMGGFTLGFGLILLIFMMGMWWRDVVREATYEGRHTQAVQRGLRLGVVLFIVSEVMFFVSFFWAFFHSSLAPSIEIGSIWPPNGIDVLNPWGVPLLNTYILLYSGVTITYAHHSMLSGDWSKVMEGLFQTLCLAVFFTALQVLEYFEAPFDISDGIYGSTFFMATGFHGFHVIVGTIFIAVCFFRTAQAHFTRSNHLGFEAAAWYWHFVDVVWLFLFVSIYFWGSN